jgi:hypothetical protein
MNERRTSTFSSLGVNTQDIRDLKMERRRAVLASRLLFLVSMVAGFLAGLITTRAVISTYPYCVAAVPAAAGRRGRSEVGLLMIASALLGLIVGGFLGILIPDSGGTSTGDLGVAPEYSVYARGRSFCSLT